MNFPSPHFTPLSLDAAFNAERGQLAEALQLPLTGEQWYGRQTLRGIPFELGQQGQANTIYLDEEPVKIEVDGVKASYLLFLHAAADRPSELPDDLTDALEQLHPSGNELGNLVSVYELEYADGSTEQHAVQRRFAIQQPHTGWGASPFTAVPAHAPHTSYSATEMFMLNRPAIPYGSGEQRHFAGRDSAQEHLWIYALPNPHPDKPLRRLVCHPKQERSAIFAISHTQLEAHPLRPGTRQKAKLTLPDSVSLNEIAELDGLSIDLGTMISARAVLEYDPAQWHDGALNAQPNRSATAVIVEYSAHPQARLYLQTGEADSDLLIFELDDLQKEAQLIEVKPAVQPVKLRIVEKGSQRPVPVRLHLHGAAGEYLPPKGYHRKVNPGWFEDNYGEFVNGLNQYCYIPGHCEVDLPQGEVFIEITRGYEIKPIRTSFVVTAESDTITFELERVLDWRAKGWVTADTHVHFLSPQTALLEGAAEGVNVVNLLASQWGEMFSNVADFDGRTTLGAKEFGGDGEFLVRVGTENRMQVLGHISLLGYSGAMIHPLCSGGPSESAIGDALEVSMADWAQRCIDQNGLVVLPHAPNPQAERAADIVLGVVNAIEMMSFNPFEAQITPYGLVDWYRYLNLGYHIPVVGGSDKMSPSMLLGGMRTYAKLTEPELSYDNWMAAVRGGDTFVTVGPLAELQVEGLSPGQVLHLPNSGGTVAVSWRVESAHMPIERVEIVMNGLKVAQTDVGFELAASGHASLQMNDSGWIALRVRGSYQGKQGEIAAHTSAVQVQVDGQPLFSEPDATAVLEQIEGAMAYVDTLAPRPDALRYKKIRATLESAYNRLHMRMHQQGVYHHHTPVHEHERPE